MNNPFVLFFRYLLSLLFFLLFQIALPAQENFQDGFLININGDTIKGQIDYRNWNVNPQTIKFKSSVDSEPVEVSPLNIKEFQVGKEQYVGAIIEYEASDLNTDRLTFDPEPDICVETVFLQTLFKGEKSLYMYRAKNGRENFYILRDGGLDLLLYKRYLQTVGGVRASDMKTIAAENLMYIGQLKSYFNTNRGFLIEIDNTEYNQTSLTKLFNAYYSRSPESLTFRREQDKLVYKVGLTLGYELYHLDFRGYVDQYLVETEYPWTAKSCFGAYFEILIPRANQHVSIVNEFLYSRFLTEGSVILYINEESYTQYDTRIGVSYLKLNTMARYSLRFGKGNLFANAGVSNGFAIKSVNELTRYKKLYTVDYTYTGVALENLRLYEFSVNAGLGYRLGHYALELRYEMGGGLSPNIFLISNIDRVFLKAEYRF